MCCDAREAPSVLKVSEGRLSAKLLEDVDVYNSYLNKPKKELMPPLLTPANE